ncbi:unnamed protein product [Sphagnum balticum]
MSTILEGYVGLDWLRYKVLMAHLFNKTDYLDYRSKVYSNIKKSLEGRIEMLSDGLQTTLHPMEAQRQELLRYSNPTKPWVYLCEDGRKVTVAPVAKKISVLTGKPRDHPMLKSERACLRYYPDPGAGRGCPIAQRGCITWRMHVLSTILRRSCGCICIAIGITNIRVGGEDGEEYVEKYPSKKKKRDFDV